MKLLDQGVDADYFKMMGASHPVNSDGTRVKDFNELRNDSDRVMFLFPFMEW